MTAMALSGEHSPAARVPPAPLAWAGFSVELSRSMAGFEADWRRLEALSGASLFQGFDYLSAWVQTAAAASGEEPIFAVGRRGSEVAFILPMALTRRHGARVLTWLGQEHSNYGMALADPTAFDGSDVDALILAVARAVKAGLVHLDKQPAEWAGRANPFALSRHSRLSANDTFVATLDEDFPTLHGRLFSSKTLAGLRRKQRRLEEQGDVVFGVPGPGAGRQDIVDWFMVEKRQQLAETGRSSPFDPPQIQALYAALARDEHGFIAEDLTVSGQRIATGMTAHQGEAAHLINTVHVGGDFAKFSPGTLLLHRMVASAHERGARIYDFGPGELPYKLEWDPKVIGLHTSISLVSPTALPAYLVAVAMSAAKTRIKRDPKLMRLVETLRGARKAKGQPEARPDAAA
jgi:CelD/BcsL family acetyltransferase involved in cellulose biosynthesis